MKIGQVCMKIAGRDAGEYCVVVEQLESGFVLVDGNTRRRKCNIKHLESVPKTVEISEGASSDQVRSALKEAGFNVVEHKKKTKTASKKEKPLKKRDTQNQAKALEKAKEIPKKKTLEKKKK